MYNLNIKRNIFPKFISLQYSALILLPNTRTLYIDLFIYCPHCKKISISYKEVFPLEVTRYSINVIEEISFAGSIAK